MDANEKLVRDTWQDPINGMLDFNRNLYPTFVDDWAVAAEFTRQHKHKVAELDYEIEVMEETLSQDAEDSSIRPSAVEAEKRTLARLQACRADLTRGMKG